MKVNRKRCLKIAGGFAGAVLLWCFLVAFSIWKDGHRVQSRPSDCAIILGAAVNGSAPSPVFEERINHGIALYQKGTVGTLIFTGGFGKESSHSEGAVGASYAVAQGVPEGDILFEQGSLTTRENLLEAKVLLQREGLKTAILVSDPLHLKRAKMMARDLEIDAVSSLTPTSRYRSWRTKLPFLMRELYFVHHYRLFGR